MRRRVAVVGGGWAGISAAVHATALGHQVTLFEMAPHLGGRARSIDPDEPLSLDNGQHILIGAYVETLALMRLVGAAPEELLWRQPLSLVGPDGCGLRLPPGSPTLSFGRAVLGQHGWSLRERCSLLYAALRWRLQGFKVSKDISVESLTRNLSNQVRRTMVEPLCVAALNTPANLASARVFLRVLHDALFSGAGSADLLLPRVPLSGLLPAPATRWLAAAGADVQCRTRVASLDSSGATWNVDGRRFDGVVLACSANEAARLVRPIAPTWATQAAAFHYEPIVTVYLTCGGVRLAQPMTTLASDASAPAQFAFDLGAIDGGGPRDGLFAFVISGARGWVDKGLEATAAATLRQAQAAFPGRSWREATVLRTLSERRATFLCTPGLTRPPAFIAGNLIAAGDYVEGPYPATLEGAVRSGSAAAKLAAITTLSPHGDFQDTN